VWQGLYEELGPKGLVPIAVALDEDLDAVNQWARDESPVPLTYPMLVDRDHLVAEQYGIMNIPTTVWIDEHDRVVRPPSIAPADDKFRDFTQIDSSVHHAALRSWVLDGVAPLTDDEVRDRQIPPDPAVQQARAERGHDCHRQQNGRDREDQVRSAPDDLVDPPSEIAGERAQCAAAHQKKGEQEK